MVAGSFSLDVGEAKTRPIEDAGRVFEALQPTLSRATIARCARQLKAAAAKPIDRRQIAVALARACESWRDRTYEPRVRTLEQIAARLGFSLELLDESLDALLEPFKPRDLERLAQRTPGRRVLLGFVMPGNVVGAGLHELVQALTAGAAVLVKSAASEPFFFTEFARSVAQVNPALEQRIAVTAFDRARRDLSCALAHSVDALVAFGSDDTIAALRRLTPNLIPFGSRVSGGFVDCEGLAPAKANALAAALARDVVLFEQRGCLSLHHLFVRARQIPDARKFAARLARALERIARRLPAPRELELGDSAPVRAAREEARWRRIGGEEVDLWEGSDLSYAVIFDPRAIFRISPAYRTVYVSAVRDQAELERRLVPVKGKLEAFAIFDPRGRCAELAQRLTAFGVSHACAPGAMQSPQVDWPHDRARLLRYLRYR